MAKDRWIKSSLSNFGFRKVDFGLKIEFRISDGGFRIEERNADFRFRNDSYSVFSVE